jgi:multidrug resistance efflux pump
LEERVKQAQEKTDQQFQELKEGQRQLKEGLEKDINQALLECRRSNELLRQEVSEKLNTEVEKVTIEVNQVKGEVKKCENKLEREI